MTQKLCLLCEYCKFCNAFWKENLTHSKLRTFESVLLIGVYEIHSYSYFYSFRYHFYKEYSSYFSLADRFYF